MLIIMQGPPGSGKTTIAEEQLAEEYDAEIYSTDDFFTEDGVYNFDISKLNENHQKNQDRTFKALKEGKNVIVDNTNIMRWHCKAYVQAAVELGIEVKFVRAEGDYKTIHGVPQDKIEQMRASMEDLTVESVLASKAPWE